MDQIQKFYGLKHKLAKRMLLSFSTIQIALRTILPCLILLLACGQSQATCRQALAIGLDISGSVDDVEYRLQLDGLANAMLQQDVKQAFLAMPHAPVHIFIYEWAGKNLQNTLVPWTPVADETALQQIVAILLSKNRQTGEITTALGQAILFGNHALTQQIDCWRLTLDLSGDGQSNSGPRPRDVQTLVHANVTINAIVIGADGGTYVAQRDSEIGKLTSYFASEVIRGPDAFVEAALGFEDFEDAMTRKLLKELQTRVVGALPSDGQ